MEIKDFDKFNIVVLEDGIIYVCKNKEVLQELQRSSYKDVKCSADLKYNPLQTNVVFISLHASSKCNLACKYCFKKERDESEISIEKARKFIRDIALQFSHVDKIIVDPTGSGEPFLQLDKIIQIKQFCDSLMDELKIEIVMYLATNGTLLDKEKINLLQESGILFGISLDAFGKKNDLLRTYPNGEGTFKKIKNNLKLIKHRHFLGVAVTVTEKNLNLIKNIKKFKKEFYTVSFKPVRGLFGVNENNIDEFKNAYSELMYFLLDNITIKNNMDYFTLIINGEDYFAKFLHRAIINNRVTTRCDAGFGRFSLSSDDKIYACPGGVDIKELVVGTLSEGVDYNRVNEIHDVLVARKHCQSCYAKYICGGECLVSAYYKENAIDGIDRNMCKFKRHLTDLALYFRGYLELYYPKHFDLLYKICLDKDKHLKPDEEILDVLKKTDKYTFTELRHIQFHNQDKFNEIKNSN